MNPSLKKGGYTALVLVVGLAIAFALLVGKPRPEARPEQPRERPGVDVLAVQLEDTVLVVHTQGTVAPRREIDLVAQVAGTVVSVAGHFANGGFFTAGDELLLIEPADYEHALVRAESQLADAQQLLATEKARAVQAKREWRDLGSQEANDLFLRKPQLAATQAALRAAEAERDQARLDLTRTRIVAPFNGRVREARVDLGQYVTTGAAVARYYSTDVVEVRLPVTDRQLALLDLPRGYEGEGMELQPEVEISAVIGGERWTWQGRITRTDASIDVDSRLLYAVAEVDAPFARDAGSKRPPLNVGQFVEARIAGRAQEGVVILPRRALQPEDRIWVLDDADRLVSQRVNVLQADESQVVVRGNLPEGSRVVVQPLSVMIAGQVVSPRVPQVAESRP